MEALFAGGLLVVAPRGQSALHALGHEKHVRRSVRRWMTDLKEVVDRAGDDQDDAWLGLDEMLGFKVDLQGGREFFDRSPKQDVLRGEAFTRQGDPFHAFQGAKFFNGNQEGSLRSEISLRNERLISEYGGVALTKGRFQEGVDPFSIEFSSSCARLFDKLSGDVLGFELLSYRPTSRAS